MLARGELDPGLALVWLADPVDAFFLHVQGSGRVALEDGLLKIRVPKAAAARRKVIHVGQSA